MKIQKHAMLWLKMLIIGIITLSLQGCVTVAVHHTLQQKYVFDTVKNLEQHFADEFEKCVTCPSPYPFGKAADRERQQLLYETDHNALLEACREIMEHRHSYRIDPGWYGTKGSEESFIDPTDERLPGIIHTLQPRDVIATDTRVDIELHGGFDHYGVFAVAEHLEQQDQKRVGLKLLDGLWYYDEGFLENQYWMQKLLRLKPSHMTPPTWWPQGQDIPQQELISCSFCTGLYIVYGWDFFLMYVFWYNASFLFNSM